MTDPAPWWHSAVVYQIYPRSFADSNGDGIGDLRGVTSRLDHLVALGVDVVWLSPFFASPQDDFGYDISDYRDVDPLFGTLADCRDLIAACHERGLKIMFDLVMNHTSDEHAWFVESRDPASPKRGWYYWRPARSGREPGTPGAEPTNWGSAFGGPAWEFDPTSGEYFLHLFSRKQPDLNWGNPAVRAALFEMMNYWRDLGVDGFRMDVINLIGKPAELVDAPGAGPDGLSYGWTEFGDTERTHAHLAELHRRTLAGTELVTVGETPGVTVAEGRRYTDPARAELDMLFTFEHVEVDHAPGGSKWDLAPLHLPDLKRALARWQEGLADVGWNSLYWDNHDQPRIVSRWGDDSPAHRVTSAKTLATVLHCLRGTPYVYQGEELGMTNAGFTALASYQDIESRNFAGAAAAAGVPEAAIVAALSVKSRDNARTPMQWTAGANAGFTEGTPWLPVTSNHRQINAEAELADPGSVFHHYRALIAQRHESELVREGTFELLCPEDPAVFAYRRELGDAALVVVANLSGRQVTVPAGVVPAGSRVGFATHVDLAEGVLRPWESRVHYVG